MLRKHFQPSRNTSSQPKPFLMRYGRFLGASKEPIDQVLAVFMPAGRSYTGLDQVEIFCHGGDQVLRRLLEELIHSGARAADPGEFTRLAFENGRINLSEAEAVAEIVAANTEQSYRVAREHLIGAYTEHVTMLRNQLTEIMAETEASVDYPEEDIDLEQKDQMLRLLDRLTQQTRELADTYRGGRIIREGFTIAIAGRPNAGKSSLFNLLLKQERALVAPTAGTTRDYLSEWIDLGGYAVRLIDTAGIRSGGGQIEKAGQAQAKRLMEEADLVLWLADVSAKGWQAHLKKDKIDLNKQVIICLYNKIDILEKPTEAQYADNSDQSIAISCVTEVGIAELKEVILERIRANQPDLTSGLVVTSARHHQKLERASERLAEARSLLELDESPEIISLELRGAADQLDEITGRIYTEDILEQIFAKFCVGK